MKLEELLELKQEVRVLHMLLEEPEPGLFTWQQAVLERWKKIAEMWGK